MNKKIVPVLVVTTLIFLMVIGAGITFVVGRYTPTKERVDLNEYYGINGENEIPIIYNDEVVEAKGKVIDGTPYFDFATVSTYINSRYYWDSYDNILIYTTPTEIITLDPKQETSGVIIQDEVGYISLETIQNYSDISCVIYENPTRLVVRTNDESEMSVVESIQDTVIRKKGGIKSPIITDIKKGESLMVLEELEDWIKVSSEDGYTGYTEKKKVGSITTKPIEKNTQELEYTSITKDYKINLAWHQVTEQSVNATIQDVLNKIKGVNTISPTWFSIKDNEGNITSLANADYVKTVHAAGIEVWGLVDNFSKDMSSFEVLSHTKSRRNLIAQLMQEVNTYDLDGINVDLEAITEETGPHFIQFLRELSIECRKAGIVLSVDNPVPMSYTKHYNRKEQGIVVDYVIVMGYDEHTNGSSEAGSVASLPFVTNGVMNTVKEVPAQKVINAIPFYTRLWTTEANGAVSSKVFGMNGAKEYVEQNGLDIFWDQENGQTCGELEDENGLYQIWLEDEKSIEEKMKLVPEYNLAGVAEWKLGLQNDEIWEVISKYLQ